LSSAVEYLRQESARLDPDPDPQRRGVNLLLRLPPLTPAAAPVAAASPDGANAASGPAPEFVPTANMRITVNLSRIPLQEALQYVASEAGLKLRVEPYAVCLVPLNDRDETMITKVFRVPPNLISNATSNANGTFGNTALDQPATAAH
jgi:general secretion pathway protein D